MGLEGSLRKDEIEEDEEGVEYTNVHTERNCDNFGQIRLKLRQFPI